MRQRAILWSRQLCTRATIARWVAIARARGIKLTVKVHPTARVDPGATLEVFRGSTRTVTMELGPHARLERGCLVRATGGASVLLGPSAVIRRFAVLNISGNLEMLGDNLLSWHSVVHCAAEVVFEPMAGTGEGVTVVDGRHFRRHEADHWYYNSATSPVRIGSNAWLASHSTIGPGVTVGAASTVAAGSVVLTDVPHNSLVAGAPARVVRSTIDVEGLDEPAPEAR